MRKNEAPPAEQQAAEVAALEVLHNENPDQQVNSTQDHTYQKKVCKMIFLIFYDWFMN